MSPLTFQHRKSCEPLIAKKLNAWRDRHLKQRGPVMEGLRNHVSQMLLIVYGVFLGFYTLTFSQNEDMGVFITETSFIAKGLGAYSQIFELKDPLFLWIGGLSNWLFGLRGPFLIDAIAVMFSPLAAFTLARKFNLGNYWSLICAIAFSGALSGTFYQSFRTGTIALVLIVFSLIAARSDRWLVCGALAAAVIGFKMSYAPMLGGVFILLISGNQIMKRLAKFSLSFLTLMMGLVIALFLRGEMAGYILMVKTNFHYRSVYPDVVGLTPGFAGYVKVIKQYGSSFEFLMLTLVVIVIAVSMLKGSFENYLVLGSLPVTFSGSILVLISSAMWSHHLQVICIVLLMTGIIAGHFVEQFHLRRTWKHQLLCGLLIFAFLGTLSASGWRIPMRPLTPAKQWLNPKWNVPEEITYLGQLNLNRVEQKKFARVGPNDDNGLGGFLSTDWVLVCRHYAQYGHETKSMVNEIVDCISTEPKYLFLSPGFYALTRQSGTYENLKSRIQTTLNENFTCAEVPNRLGAKFCTRIAAPNS